jgi:hypothetical protein
MGRIEAMNSVKDDLRLEGLDGGNPLGFLALLGTLCMASRFASQVHVRWQADGHGWRPVFGGHSLTRTGFAEAVHAALVKVGNAPFELDSKLPFACSQLRASMVCAAAESSMESRRTVDVLAGFGSDAFTDEVGLFEDTALRLVRTGDAAGQGLPRYVIAARDGLHVRAIDAALFEPWRYEDECFSLRWAPLEDQRYALRADDPSKSSNKRAGSRGVKAANALAAEALSLLPVQPQAREVCTTGFSVIAPRTLHFTWPIWVRPCGIDIVRSLLAHPECSARDPNREALTRMGIDQIFRSERFPSSDYYKNFAPAQPV